MKQLVLALARGTGLFAISRWLTRGQLRILCYHGIWTGGSPHFGDCLFMRAETFRQRLDFLERKAYPVLALDEAIRRLEDGNLPAAAVVITIDDAWHGIVDHMLRPLTERKWPATLYVTTYYALAQRPVLNVLINFIVSRAQNRPSLESLLPSGADGAAQHGEEDYASELARRVDQLPTLDERWSVVEDIASRLEVDLSTVELGRVLHLMNPAELQAAHAAGVDIQLHTHTHRMHDFDHEKVREDIEQNRRELVRILNVAPAALTHFCYPSGVHAVEVYPALAAAGVSTATTTEFGLNGRDADRLALKRILDCESMSELDLEARLSGFWSLAAGVRKWLTSRAG